MLSRCLFFLGCDCFWVVTVSVLFILSGLLWFLGVYSFWVVTVSGL